MGRWPGETSKNRRETRRKEGARARQTDPTRRGPMAGRTVRRHNKQESSSARGTPLQQKTMTTNAERNTQNARTHARNKNKLSLNGGNPSAPAQAGQRVPQQPQNAPATPQNALTTPPRKLERHRTPLQRHRMLLQRPPKSLNATGRSRNATECSCNTTPKAKTPQDALATLPENGALLQNTPRPQQILLQLCWLNCCFEICFLLLAERQRLGNRGFYT